jgi:hypothetical protein
MGHAGENLCKGFIGGEDGMPAGEHVTLGQSVHGVLGEHFHHPAVTGNVLVTFVVRPDKTSRRNLENFIESVGIGLVRR